MNQIIDKSDIQKIIENSNELMSFTKNDYEIQVFSKSVNSNFKILGNSNIIAKVGYTGWGKYEFDTLKLLSSKNYNVPKPIIYISLQKGLNDYWSFGDIKREVGVLFYLLVEGKNLKQDLTKINILNGLNFLKRIHEDRSLTGLTIKDYQKVEVDRGLNYTKKLFKGDFSKNIQNKIQKYQDYEINYCLIHGGPRLEHFIVKDNQIWMIDFEGTCLGDRFKDLGIYFTELLLHDFNKEEFIKAYFGRKLNENENARLKFFELRALIVKYNFEPSQAVLKHINELIE